MIYFRAHFGQGESSSPIWLDNVQCTGVETSISDCIRNDHWGVHNCYHYEDAGVSCTGIYLCHMLYIA